MCIELENNKTMGYTKCDITFTDEDMKERKIFFQCDATPLNAQEILAKVYEIISQSKINAENVYIVPNGYPDNQSYPPNITEGILFGDEFVKNIQPMKKEEQKLVEAIKLAINKTLDNSFDENGMMKQELVSSLNEESVKKINDAGANYIESMTITIGYLIYLTLSLVLIFKTTTDTPTGLTLYVLMFVGLGYFSRIFEETIKKVFPRHGG